MSQYLCELTTIWTMISIGITSKVSKPESQLFEKDKRKDGLRRKSYECGNVSLEETNWTRLCEQQSNTMTNTLVFVGTGIHKSSLEDIQLLIDKTIY